MDSPQNTYRLARQRSALTLSRVCLALALLPFIEIAINLISEKEIDTGPIAVTVFWLLLWGFFSIFIYRWAKTAKLEITPSHISCDDIASLAGFSTKWENIRKVEVSKMRLILWLQEPSIPITKLGRWAHNHSVISPDMIDLSSFIDHWRGGELKHDFERCAPHLFDSDSESEGMPPSTACTRSPAENAAAMVVGLAAPKREYATLKPIPSKWRCLVPPTSG